MEISHPQAGGGHFKGLSEFGAASWQSHPVFQCKMIIKDVSAATMYDVLQDGEYRKKWDPNVLESYDIAKLSENADVGYYSCESVFLFFVFFAVCMSFFVCLCGF